MKNQDQIIKYNEIKINIQSQIQYDTTNFTKIKTSNRATGAGRDHNLNNIILKKNVVHVFGRDHNLNDIIKQ